MLHGSEVCGRVEKFITPHGPVAFHVHCLIKARGAGSRFWSAHKDASGCAWCEYQEVCEQQARTDAWRAFMKTTAYKRGQRKSSKGVKS